MKGLRIAVIVAVGTLFVVAPRVHAQANDLEFKCEKAVNKAGVKFVASKSKCVQKCLATQWKSLTPNFADCYPPYGGTTAECIFSIPLKPGKSAEEKFTAAILKACVGDPLKVDCPECYSGGDCTTESTDRVQNIEGQVDSFVPGVGCEGAGATKDEQKCETGTAKALTKQVATLNKCYDKCVANVRKSLIPAGSCNPPSSDPATQTCVSTGDGKTIAAIDKACLVDPADCSAPNDYPDGAAWTNLVDSAITGNVPSTYCEGDL